MLMNSIWKEDRDRPSGEATEVVSLNDTMYAVELAYFKFWSDRL